MCELYDFACTTEADLSMYVLHLSGSCRCWTCSMHARVKGLPAVHHLVGGCVSQTRGRETFKEYGGGGGGGMAVFGVKRQAE